VCVSARIRKRENIDKTLFIAGNEKVSQFLFPFVLFDLPPSPSVKSKMEFSKILSGKSFR